MTQTRRERARRDRRAQILDAARGLLFEHGLAAASMSRIAAAADLSVGTLYLHFRDKEDLLAALQEEGLDILHVMVRDAVAGEGGAPEKLERIGLAYLAFSETHRKYFDLIGLFLASPTVSFSPATKDRIDAYGGRVLSLVAQVLREAGLWRDRRGAQRAAVGLWGALHGLLQMRKFEPTLLAAERFERFYRAQLRRLIAGWTAPVATR